MRRISAQDVLGGVERQLALAGTPLPEDRVHIPAQG
jgi:hypothetical protein